MKKQDTDWDFVFSNCVVCIDETFVVGCIEELYLTESGDLYMKNLSCSEKDWNKIVTTSNEGMTQSNPIMIQALKEKKQLNGVWLLQIKPIEVNDKVVYISEAVASYDELTNMDCG